MSFVQLFFSNWHITIVNVINRVCLITFVSQHLFTKEKCIIFVKITDYARKIVEFDESGATHSK